jgi:hypothetical protein
MEKSEQSATPKYSECFQNCDTPLRLTDMNTKTAYIYRVPEEWQNRRRGAKKDGDQTKGLNSIESEA